MKKVMSVLALFVLVTGIVFAEAIEVKVQNINEQPVLFGTDSLMVPATAKSRDLTDVFFEKFESGAPDWTAWDATATPPMWHIDTYNAYGGTGMSWWMGDPNVSTNGGYLDNWYQVMDTPPIYLPSGTDNLLYFEQFRAIESLGSNGNFNGWDGMNVRIRLATEEYSEAEVLTDCNPAYNSTSMYSFGYEHGECPTGIPGIPGWGGSTSGWESTTITIPSDWNGENVIISFAFASDPSYCTEDDPDLIGVFVDNIALANFYNAGDDTTGFDMFSNVPEGGQLWHIYDDAAAPSPTHAAGCFDPGTGVYNPNMDNYYISPEFELPEGLDIVWDMYVQTELDDGEFPDCDYIYVQIRYNDGNGWGNWNSVSNPTGDPNGSDYVFTGSITEWIPFSEGWPGYSDISALSGYTVQFRVGLHSDGGEPSTFGFHVDNFQVMETLDVPSPSNLTAEYSDQTGFVDLAWNAPAGMGGAMQWDDGYFESAISFTTGSGYMGTSFPVKGQCQILEFTVFGSSLLGQTTLGVYEKEGLSYSTIPTYTMQITTSATGSTYDVSENNWIVENSFLLTFECNSQIDCALDESSIPSKYSYINTGATWSKWSDVAAVNGLQDGEWGIRCTTTHAIVDPPNSYNIYRGEKTGSYSDNPIGNTTDTLFIDETVFPGKSYYYTVAAVYDEGESPYSNEASTFVEIATAFECIYDDGTVESSYSIGTPGNCLAVRVTPEHYPVKLIRIKYYFTEINQDLILYAWDDDGVNGSPGKPLIDLAYVVPAEKLIANEWNIITLPGSKNYNVLIDSGDFFIGMVEGSRSNYIGVDSDDYPYNRSWQYTAGSWYNYSAGIPQNIMIRAIIDTFPKLKADFTADTVDGTFPHEVHFKDQSANVFSQIVEWNWDFGDEQASSEKDPIHTYVNPGKYSVSLTVRDENDSTSTIIKEDYIHVYPQVWPGDTDNNGIVDTLDILPIGIYFRSTGNARENISYNWTANEFPALWEDEAAAPADCNGDGIVNISDVLAIGLNMGKLHQVTLNSQSQPIDLEPYKGNFQEIYNSLGESETDILIKNFIARRLEFQVVEPEGENILGGSYPNPFSGSTSIQFSLKDNVQSGNINIYNVKGQLVKQFEIDTKDSHENRVSWDGSDLNNKQVGSGIYFYVLILNDQIISTKRMVLMK